MKNQLKLLQKDIIFQMSKLWIWHSKIYKNVINAAEHLPVIGLVNIKKSVKESLLKLLKRNKLHLLHLLKILWINQEKIQSGKFSINNSSKQWSIWNKWRKFNKMGGKSLIYLHLLKETMIIMSSVNIVEESMLKMSHKDIFQNAKIL